MINKSWYRKEGCNTHTWHMSKGLLKRHCREPKFYKPGAEVALYTHVTQNTGKYC